MSYQSTYLNIDIQEYSVVFAMDWSFSTNSMLAYKFKDSKKIKQKEVPSEIKSLKNYFTQFKGKKLIVFWGDDRSPLALCGITKDIWSDSDLRSLPEFTFEGGAQDRQNRCL